MIAVHAVLAIPEKIKNLHIPAGETISGTEYRTARSCTASNICSVYRILDQAAFVKRVRIKIFGIGNTIKFPMAVGVYSLCPTIWAALIIHLESYKILTDEPYRSTGHGRRYDLRIATWNIERLRHKKFLEQILFACEQTQADILVLTK